MDGASLEQFWRFARGDLAPKAFESWVFGNDGLETGLGDAAYLDLISLDFGDARAVATLRFNLRQSLPAPEACWCHTVPDRGAVGLGDAVMETLDNVERELSGIPWLHRLMCRVCSTRWTAASEDLIHDLWLLSREEAAQWPEVRTYRGLLASARVSGGDVHYADPLDSVELPAAIRALAEETPGIGLGEIVDLLPVPLPAARGHAQAVMAEHGVRIDLER